MGKLHRWMGMAALLAAVGAGAADEPLADCKFSALVSDNDPAGYAVRDKAAGDAKVLARLSVAGGAIVAVTGFQNGWFRVSEAENDPDPPQKPKNIFKGPGFVAAGTLTREVSVKPKAPGAVFEEPNAKSKPAPALKPGGMVRVLACKGDWLKVRGRADSGPVEGWMNSDATCLATRSAC